MDEEHILCFLIPKALKKVVDIKTVCWYRIVKYLHKFFSINVFLKYDGRLSIKRLKGISLKKKKKKVKEVKEKEVSA